MVLRHFNLREQPFGVTPDPRFLFDTPTHREALAGLLYGIESGLGFIALTAQPGMGKTTILFEALRRLGKTARTVFLFQAISNPTELIRALLIDLGEKSPEGTMVDLTTQLNQVLVKQSETGQRLVVILDEAQNLDALVLEAVRMLSNFETASHKLMQIILCGRLQLADRLAEPGLLQLRQRISIFASLQSLTRSETAAYIEHRLAIAGYRGSTPLFRPEAVELIARHSGGIPRNINNLCFNALSLGCALDKTVIDANVIREVIRDLGSQKETVTEAVAIPEVDAPERERSKGIRLQLAWSGLRVVAIAAMLLVVALSAGSIYLARAGALHFQWPARASSGAQNQPPMSGQARTVVSAAPKGDLAPQTFPASQADPTGQAPVPPDTHGQAVAAQPAPAVRKDPAGNRKQSIAKLRSKQKIATNSAVQVVNAHRGESIAGICVETFNGCTTELLERILELNPEIADPDYIQPGQQIILPVIATQPRGGKPKLSGE